MATETLDDQFAKLKVTNTDINILLLGETGVGKSTFINAIANYLTCSSDFEKAENDKLVVLIPSIINIDDKNGRNRKINIGKKDENEILNVGESATQDVKTYVFPIWNDTAKVRIIDTPGMGDTRGIKQDDINSENILTYISQLKELHAICFLFRPDRARSTVFFQYCIAQIFSRLDKSASNNIIFVFTGTRGANYTPGDTMHILRKTIDEIRNRPPHVQIPLRRNVFCFENESFKYLAAFKENVEFRKSDREKYKESWKKSSSECWRLIKYIVGDVRNEPLKPHIVRNTKAINEARRMIIHMAKPLADISECINDNMDILQRHEDTLKRENLSLEELKKKLFMPVVNLEVIKQTQPVTVCTSRACSEIYKVGDKNKWHYKQRCHDPCYLTNVPKEIIGSPELVNCASINRSNKRCIKCACDFSIHMHIYYMTKTKDDTIKDDNVEMNINTKEKLLENKRKLIENIKIRKKEFEDEQKVIIKTCAKFAHFLQNNAITPFSDCYKEYIEYLISREKSLGEMCNTESLRNLQRLLVEYEEAKKFFDETKAKSGISSSITPEEICTGIESLYKLKHNGKKIKELYECQTKSRKKEYKNTEYVHKSIPNRNEKKEGKLDNKKASDSDKKTKGSDREGSRQQKRDNNYLKSPQSQTNNSANYQHPAGSYQSPQNLNYYNAPYEPRTSHHNIPPLMGAPPPTVYDRTEPRGNRQGYDSNIHVNRDDGSQSGAANSPYSSLPPQDYYNYYNSSHLGHPPSYSYAQHPDPYPSPNYVSRPQGFGYEPSNSYGGYYQQPGYDSRAHGAGYFGPSGSYSNPLPQGNQHFGPPRAGNFHNQHQSGHRQSGNGRARNNNRGQNYRAGKGRRGVNKNYKSGNQKKKTEKKQTDSDSESSSSSISSDS